MRATVVKYDVMHTLIFVIPEENILSRGILNTQSRLVNVIAKQTFFRQKHQLPSVAKYDELLHERVRKRQEIWNEFYATDVVIIRNCTKLNKYLRKVITRLAVHVTIKLFSWVMF
jgi:hypothetical protein